MIRTIARLILAMLILPVTGAVFLLGFVATIPRMGPPRTGALLAMWSIVYALDATYWLLLWRRVVRWTPLRVMRTALVSVLALSCGCGMGLLCGVIARGAPPQFAVLLGGGVVPIVWVLGTVFVWRETHDERLARLAAIGATVACPTCGYNMAGLKTAVCPEGGGQFTLDQFVAAQPRESRAN